jgi:hypothetical protein
MKTRTYLLLMLVAMIVPVACSDGLGKGSVFAVRLPLAPDN